MNKCSHNRQGRESKRKGFHEERWDQKYPEYQQASWQKLKDNAA